MDNHSFIPEYPIQTEPPCGMNSLRIFQLVPVDYRWVCDSKVPAAKHLFLSRLVGCRLLSLLLALHFLAEPRVAR